MVGGDGEIETSSRVGLGGSDIVVFESEIQHVKIQLLSLRRGCLPANRTQICVSTAEILNTVNLVSEFVSYSRNNAASCLEHVKVWYLGDEPAEPAVRRC